MKKVGFRWLNENGYGDAYQNVSKPFSEEGWGCQFTECEATRQIRVVRPTYAGDKDNRKSHVSPAPPVGPVEIIKKGERFLKLH